MRCDLWAEVPSPIKNDFVRLFYEYTQFYYEKSGNILTSYIPTGMSSCMPKEDYICTMPQEEIPDSFFSLAYSEPSHRSFSDKLINTGIYTNSEICGFFPEVMVIDLVKLNGRKIPQNYDELLDDSFAGEICTIGNPAIPDPTLGLYILRKFGENGLQKLSRNKAGFISPSKVIRHIGKKSNCYGTVFIIPAMFAAVCGKNKDACVIIPDSGAIAEPFLLFQKAEGKNITAVSDFFRSSKFRAMMNDKMFVSGENEGEIKIDRSGFILPTPIEMDILRKYL